MALYRSRKNRILAGVCGGLAERLEVDPLLFRIVYVIASVFTGGGPGVLLYLLLWWMMPDPGQS